MAIRTYKVTLDSKNTLAPEPVYLRQGDKTGAVVIDATLMDNGSPVPLSGLTPIFKANTADGQAVIADSTGFNIVDVSGGEFTYQVPNALSSVPGKITTAYFSFSDSSGSESTFDVAFIIKKAVDITKPQADDYIAIIDGTLQSLQHKIDAMNTDVQTILDTFNKGDFYNKAQTDSKDAATLTSAKTYADTQDATVLNSAKTYVDSSLIGVNSRIDGVDRGYGGTYATLADLETAHPNGDTKRYVVAENGHWYYWNGVKWTSGGVFQATGTNEFEAVNLCANGDFSNGTAGSWAALNSTHSVANNTLINTADGTSVSGNETVYLSDLIVGHKYYLRGLVKVTNDVCDYISIKMANSVEDSQLVVNNPITGVVYDVSFIFTATKSVSGFSFIHKYVDVVTANGKSMELKYVDIIDISQTFGSGNEPNKSQIDEIITSHPNGYIDGRVAPFADNKILMNILNDGFQPKASNLTGLSSLQNNDGLNGLVVQTGEGSFATRRLIGTTKQINVENGNGITSHPTISIPKNPILMQPEIATTSFGLELAPHISEWIGMGGSTWDGTKWTVPAKGQLKAPIAVELGAEYQIEIGWTTTNDYGVLNIPHLIVSLGTVVSPSQFTGYSDALYKLTMVANEAGTVDLILGDGLEDWYATITSVSVKKVTAKVTPSGRLGVGSFELTTMSDSIAIGNGLQKRTSGGANTAYGLNALSDLTTGNYNVAMGNYALEKLDTGLNNIGLGYAALRYLRSGYYNIGIGYSAMTNNNSGSWNIAIGNEAMRDLTTGIKNTVVGSRAMNDLTTGSSNVVMGREAGLYPNEVTNSTKTGSNNVFLGYRSGQSHNENTDESTVIGSYATARNRGTALGRKAKAGGVGSVAIGTDNQGNGATTFNDNEFVLGTENHNVKVPGTMNIRQYTPSGTTDTQGEIGDITTDDNYIYVKTSVGWKRTALETW